LLFEVSLFGEPKKEGEDIFVTLLEHKDKERRTKSPGSLRHQPKNKATRHTSPSGKVKSKQGEYNLSSGREASPSTALLLGIV
jgi:hypothetical protein